jgi:hypothetical protein
MTAAGKAMHRLCIEYRYTDTYTDTRNEYPNENQNGYGIGDTQGERGFDAGACCPSLASPSGSLARLDDPAIPSSWCTLACFTLSLVCSTP